MNLIFEVVRATRSDAPDGELVGRFHRSRDQVALAELVCRHGPVVWGVCRRALPCREDAEDAFQATFLLLARRAGTLTRHPALGPWLHRVATLITRAARRREARRRVVRMATALPDVPCADAGPAGGEARFDVDEALSSLPEKYRTVVVMCHLQGLTRREAAERLGCPEGTVSSRLATAMDRLRARLGAAAPATLVVVAVPSLLGAATVRSAAAFALSNFATGAGAAVTDLISRSTLGMVAPIKLAVTASIVAGLLLAGMTGAWEAGPTQEPPARPPVPDARERKDLPPEKLTRKWQLTAWDDLTGVRLAVFTLAVEGNKLVPARPKGKAGEWGYPISDIEWEDGRLRFKLDYGEKPPRVAWFEGRIDPKNPDRVCGVFGPRDAAADENGLVRRAELEVITGDGPANNFAAMPGVMTPGLAVLNARLADTQNLPLITGKPLTDEQRRRAADDFLILQELAAGRKPDRKGFLYARLLVRYAHFGPAKPGQVEAWLSEILQFAAPHGPRYGDLLRGMLARDLETGGGDYKTLVTRLRAGEAMKPAQAPNKE